LIHRWLSPTPNLMDSLYTKLILLDYSILNICYQIGGQETEFLSSLTSNIFQRRNVFISLQNSTKRREICDVNIRNIISDMNNKVYKSRKHTRKDSRLRRSLASASLLEELFLELPKRSALEMEVED